VDFSFSDEQTELRQAVRQTLGRACPTSALRDFYEANAERRAALAHDRWNAFAALGAPGLLVPESADGLGLNDVDLVGVLEEAGWAALPEPLLETAGLAAPMLAALLPAASAATALGALLTGNAPVAVGGIDIGVAGPSSPTTVAADGMLRTERVVGARDAAVYLMACRDPDSGWQLHAVPAAVCAVHTTPTLDAARDLSTVHWPLSSDTLLAYGVAAEASISLMADRGAAGSAAFLVGLADRMITLAADYAKDRHQFGKPIGSFQAVKHLLANARVKLEFARPATDRLPRCLHGEGHGIGCRRPRRPRGAAGARSHRLHLGVRSPFLHEADVGPFCRLGQCRHPPSVGVGAGPAPPPLEGVRRLSSRVP